MKSTVVCSMEEGKKRHKTQEEKIAFFRELDQLFQSHPDYKVYPEWSSPPYLPLERIRIFFIDEKWKKPFFSYTRRYGKSNSLGPRLYRMYQSLGIINYAALPILF